MPCRNCARRLGPVIGLQNAMPHVSLTTLCVHTALPPPADGRPPAINTSTSLVYSDPNISPPPEPLLVAPPIAHPPTTAGASRDPSLTRGRALSAASPRNASPRALTPPETSQPLTMLDFVSELLAVVTASLAVAQTIVELVSAIRDAPQEVRNVGADADSLATLLTSLTHTSASPSLTLNPSDLSQLTPSLNQSINQAETKIRPKTTKHNHNLSAQVATQRQLPAQPHWHQHCQQHPQQHVSHTMPFYPSILPKHNKFTHGHPFHIPAASTCQGCFQPQYHHPNCPVFHNMMAQLQFTHPAQPGTQQQPCRPQSTSHVGPNQHTLNMVALSHCPRQHISIHLKITVTPVVSAF